MKKVHFIGIGGIGMSGLARLLVHEGCIVSGSDKGDNPLLEALRKEGVTIHLEHAEENVPEDAVIVYSSAIKDDNPEWQKSLNLNLPKMHRSELLKKIADKKKMLAVTGTHGKTTTSTLLAAVLKEGGFDPSYAVGGVYLKEATNAAGGLGEHFVMEADESDGSFLNYHPTGAIVTNIDDDHLDHFGTFEKLKRAFGQFMDQVTDPELLFWCYDNEPLRSLQKKGVSYGFGEGAICKAYNFRSAGFMSFVDISLDGKDYKDIALNMIGKTLCLNAVAVFGLASRLGVSEASLRDSLRTFSGVKRRRENKPTAKSTASDFLIFDDYGHHPTEIRVTLNALKEAIGSRRLVVLFQPHRYSRTQICYEGFKTAFGEADLLVLTDLYGAGEKAIEGISSLKLAHDLSAHHFSKETVVTSLVPLLKKGDVIVTMGAGDITYISDELAKAL